MQLVLLVVYHITFIDSLGLYIDHHVIHQREKFYFFLSNLYALFIYLFIYFSTKNPAFILAFYRLGNIVSVK